jgi:hypothetical protein
MRNTFLKTIGGVALAISLLTMFATQKAFSEQGGGGRLEGTWNVQVTLRNCQTGAEIRTFPELTTFMFGGTMIDSTSGVRDDIYRFSFKSLNFSAGGTFTGSTKVTHEATLNSNATEYSSVGTAEIYNPEGTLVFTGCSTTTATRFE